MLDSDVNQSAGPLPEPVSSGREQLILVDSSDRVVGYGSKGEIHEGQGQLHRAFSAFLFDRKGRLLLHRRSGEKPLWPFFWTNSCCSHPRRGERLEGAVRRRLQEELGVTASALQRVYSFEYHASFDDSGSEHELCHVFLARSVDDEIHAHVGEIAEWRWYEAAEVDSLLGDDDAATTPWFRQEWRSLRRDYRTVLDEFLENVDSQISRNVA